MNDQKNKNRNDEMPSASYLNPHDFVLIAKKKEFFLFL